MTERRYLFKFKFDDEINCIDFKMFDLASLGQESRAESKGLMAR